MIDNKAVHAYVLFKIPVGAPLGPFFEPFLNPIESPPRTPSARTRSTSRKMMHPLKRRRLGTKSNTMERLD